MTRPRLILLAILAPLAPMALAQDVERPQAGQEIEVVVPEDGGVLYYRTGAATAVPATADVDMQLLRRLIREELAALSAAGEIADPAGLDMLRLEAALQRRLSERLRRLRALDPGRAPAPPLAAPGSRPITVVPGQTIVVPGQTVVVPEAAPQPGAPVEPAFPLPPPRVQIPGVTPLPPAAVATDVVRIEVERELLETGLFRAVGVNFEFDRADLLPASRLALDAIGGVLQRHPGLAVQVQGHTDDRGSAEYNRGLSQRRAEAVRDYLLARYPAIDEARIEAVGMGQEQPIAANDTPTGRTLNRRVDFVVVGTTGQTTTDLVEVELREEEEETPQQRLERIIREELEGLR